MPVIDDPMRIPGRRGTVYPVPLAAHLEGREKRALTDPLGLTQFGVNLTILEPGAQSSHRHWHAQEDEMVYIIEGEATLITNDGATILKPGMLAGFPRGVANAHHLVNRSTARVLYLEVGTRAAADTVAYADVDLQAEKRDGGAWQFLHKDGTPYA
ncbi:MAG: cupin domain-containing protein [Hyphomicrobium sp.]